jgi:hypothetical protein
MGGIKMTDYIPREARRGMKYISTDALGDTLENFKERKIVTYAELVSEIAAIPAADVAPVVRGKWFYGGQKVLNETFPVYICSNCKKAIPAEWERKCNFCPNCGARVEES